MSNNLIIPKGKLYDRVLSKVLSNIKHGSIMLLDQNGFRIAEKYTDPKNNDEFWGSANRIIDAGEKVLKELNQSKFNQVFESESYLLMCGPVNQDISYAILSSKDKMSLGMLKLHAQSLCKEVNMIDNPNM
ncbi:MAG: hypothetical protein ACTSO9_02215 [Candidatus Helarchaeota archaeon]